MKAKYFYFHLFGILFCFLSCFYSLNAFAANDLPVIREGYIDLSQWDKTTPIPLKGEWKFFWKELLSPKNIKSSSQTHFSPFSQLWNDTLIDGKPLPGQGYATYALDIQSSKKNLHLALKIPDTYSAYQMWLNGEWVAGNGKVGKSKKEYLPFWLPLTQEIKLKPGKNQLIIQISNFDHYKGGASRSIVMGPADQLLKKRDQSAFADTLVSGALVMGGLFFLGLFLFGQHDTSMLYFAFFSLCFSYRIIGSGFYVLHRFLPEDFWQITTRMEYLSLFLGLWLFNQFMQKIFPDEVPDKIHLMISALCLFSTAITLFFTPYIFTQSVVPFNIFMMFFCFPYFVVVFMRALVAKRPGAFYAVLSILVLLLPVAIEILVYNKLLPPVPFIFVLGSLLFFFFQSLILSFRFAASFKKAQEEALAGIKSKSLFLATMSHELRTPMNVVIGMTELLSSSQLTQEQEEFLDVIHESGNNLLGIINDILDYSRLESTEVQFHMAPMQVQKVVKDVELVLQPLAQKKGLALNFNSDINEDIWFLTDAGRLKQILINLLNNAIKFTEVGSVSLDLNAVKAEHDHWCLKGAVQDTGIGIAPEEQAKLFADFYQVDNTNQRKFGGSGLGLAITQGLIEGLKGEIKLQSTLGKGSIFSFELPLKEATAPAQDPAKITSPLELPDFKILVVDDNEMNRLLAEATFQKLGHDIILAVNGKDALEKIEATSFNLVFMDLQMPEMNGIEATEIICKNSEHPIIIAMTANVLESDRVNCLEAGMSDFLPKPFKQSELIDMIEKWAPYSLKNGK